MTDQFPAARPWSPRNDSKLPHDEVRSRIDAMKALLPAPSKRPAGRVVAVRTPDETDDADRGAA